MAWPGFPGQERRLRKERKANPLRGSRAGNVSRGADMVDMTLIRVFSLVDAGSVI
mgnify:CR=1 FL=1